MEAPREKLVLTPERKLDLRRKAIMLKARVEHARRKARKIVQERMREDSGKDGPSANR
jgi:hypothetical protein